MEYVILISILGGVLLTVIKIKKNVGRENPRGMIVYNCSKQKLAEAIETAAGRLRWKVEKLDVQRGRVKLGVGVTWRSFGEWVFIRLTEVSPEETNIVVYCRAKRGSEVFDKNRRNIEQFFDCLDETIFGIGSGEMGVRE